MRFFRDGLEIESDGPPRVVLRDGHTCEVFKTSEGDMWFITLEGTHFCAHGDTFHDAVIAAKEKQNPGAAKGDAIERIRSTGLVRLADFCAATGACRAGATAWAKQEGVSVKDALKVDEVLRRLAKSSSSSWGQTLREELGNEWNN